MLKIRIIAALIAIVLTVITAYLVPKFAYYYTHLVNGLSHEQQIWLNWAQAFIGILIGVYGFWLWKKKSKSKNK